jgi:hypothetical protein
VVGTVFDMRTGSLKPSSMSSEIVILRPGLSQSTSTRAMAAMESRILLHVMILLKNTIEVKEILNAPTERCSRLRNYVIS